MTVVTRGSADANEHERPGDREGEMERRDRETGEAEWKPRPNRRERTDARVQVFPFRGKKRELKTFKP